MMDVPLLPDESDPKKPFWRPWKWVGLVCFVLALVLKSWLNGLIFVLGCLFGLAVLFNLLFFGLRYLKDRVFWRVRNRLLGSFIFVGFLPLLLILVTIYIAARLLAGQLAANYLETSVRAMEQEISVIGNEVAEQVTSQSPLELEPMVAKMLTAHQGQFPKLAARFLRRRNDGTFKIFWQFDPNRFLPLGDSYPAEKWLGPSQRYEGLLLAGRQALIANVRPIPRLTDCYLDISAPLDRIIEDRLQKEHSIYAVFTGMGRTRVIRNKTNYTIQINEQAEDSSSDKAGTTSTEVNPGMDELIKRSKDDPRRKIFWWTLLRAKDLYTGSNAGAALVLLEVPLSTLYQNYLVGTFQQGKALLFALGVMAGLFLFAELISIVIGFTISRRITKSIHDMYQGTLALQKGDLQYKIPVRKKDQLGLLAHSFNQMSASIVRLLDEVSEKKRLEQELEIAREVQATLFPKQLPSPRGLAIFGGCEPARTVSGDYYDFIVEDESHLHIVVGDVSGKGISAALLMANLQAAMRNQLLTMRGGPEDLEQRLAEVMTRLNEQIYLNSPSEKYVTLFSSRYDAERHHLCYCNAGHLPPILLCNGDVKRLEAGGTVMGLFPIVNYQASSLPLGPGTIMAIFTDGVTEAVDSNDEEFGEERLIQSLQESRSRSPEGIYKYVTDRVREWQGSQKQHDDITLIIVKVA